MKDLTFKHCLKLAFAAGIGWGLSQLAFGAVGIAVGLILRGMSSY